VPFPVVQSVIFIAALKRCATQKHPLFVFATPTRAAKAAAVAGGGWPIQAWFWLEWAVD